MADEIKIFKVTIDNITVEVPAGTTILQAARKVGGDVAPQLQQMKNRFKAKYDYDGAKAMELRQKWWQLGEKEKWEFLFYHDIQYPVYKF